MKQYSRKVSFFVDSVNGCDEDRGSKNAPFRTLEKAFDALQSKLIHAVEETDYHINLLSGVYALTHTATLDGSKVRASDYAVTVSGIGDTTVTSNVDVPASLFTKVENKPYYVCTLPDSAKDENGNYPAFRDFYCNGNLMTLASDSVERVMDFSIPNDRNRKDPANNDSRLYIDPEAVHDIDINVPLPLELWIKVEWQLHGIRIIKIDPNDTRVNAQGKTQIAVTVHPDDWQVFVASFWGTLRGRFYYCKNQLTFVRRPNQFFYDRKNGRVYLCLPEGVTMENAVFAYPKMENLIIFRDCQNITVNHLSFTGTTSNYVTEYGYIAGQAGYIKRDNAGSLTHAALYAHNVNGFAVYDSQFRMLGGEGIDTTGISENVDIDRNAFTYIAMSAIRIGRLIGCINTFTNWNNNIRITENYIKQPGYFYRSNIGIVTGPVRNLKICHNTVTDTPYSAISVGYCWGKAAFRRGERFNITNAEIAYNRVENYMYALKDGGAIYVLGGNSDFDDHELFNRIHDNYCVAGPTTGQCTGCYTCLYHDGSSSNWETNDNVIEVCPENPTHFSYISFQSVPGQQVSNITANGNYFINMYNEELVVGGAEREKHDLHLYAKKSHFGLTLSTLDKKAKAIIENAGAEGYRKTL